MILVNKKIPTRCKNYIGLMKHAHTGEPMFGTGLFEGHDFDEDVDDDDVDDGDAEEQTQGSADAAPERDEVEQLSESEQVGYYDCVARVEKLAETMRSLVKKGADAKAARKSCKLFKSAIMAGRSTSLSKYLGLPFRTRDETILYLALVNNVAPPPGLPKHHAIARAFNSLVPPLRRLGHNAQYKNFLHIAAHESLLLKISAGYAGLVQTVGENVGPRYFELKKRVERFLKEGEGPSYADVTAERTKQPEQKPAAPPRHRQRPKAIVDTTGAGALQCKHCKGLLELHSAIEGGRYKRYKPVVDGYYHSARCVTALRAPHKTQIAASRLASARGRHDGDIDRSCAGGAPENRRGPRLQSTWCRTQ